MMISNRRFPSILALLVSLGVFLSAAFARASVDNSEIGSMRAALIKELSRSHPKKSVSKKIDHKKTKAAKVAKVAKSKNKKSKRSLQASKKKGNRVVASLGKSSRRSR